jgi:anti-sigma B factor antagonist
VHEIRIAREHGAVVVSARGELDAYAAPELTEAFDADGVREHGRLVVDLRRVSFMDSTALGLLVRIVNELGESGGRARVVLPETTARRIFEITTLDRVLPISASRADALVDLEP